MAIVCSVKEAYKLMEHMNEDDVVILTVLNRRTYLHDVPKKNKKDSRKGLNSKGE